MVRRDDSEAIQRAIRLLSDPRMDDAYAAAWQEWDDTGEAAVWEETTADGLGDATR
ncbi:MAG: hypothetical protein ABIR83_07490 [Nakamurella sp.]